MTLLKKIRLLCMEKEMSMSKMAEIIGISRESMYYKIKIKDKEVCKKIEEILNADLSSFTNAKGD